MLAANQMEQITQLKTLKNRPVPYRNIAVDTANLVLMETFVYTLGQSVINLRMAVISTAMGNVLRRLVEVIAGTVVN